MHTISFYRSRKKGGLVHSTISAVLWSSNRGNPDSSSRNTLVQTNLLILERRSEVLPDPDSASTYAVGTTTGRLRLAIEMTKKAGSTPPAFHFIHRFADRVLLIPIPVVHARPLERESAAPAYHGYLSFKDMPLGASFRLRPFVVVYRSITTPFWFFIVVAPAPAPRVPSAVAAV